MRLGLIALVAAVLACDKRVAPPPPPPPLEVGAPDATADVHVAASASAPASAVLPNIATDWCLDEWRGLDEGTCYLMPSTAPTTLLVYLSGIVPPTAKSPQKENVQRVVASAARRAGAAVLLPRGRRGIGPTDAKDWWAWPTGGADYVTYAQAMVAEWKAARTKLEAALGRPFEKMYLAGSSSGAYFLTALALAGAIDADGYCAASGGATGLGGGKGTAEKRPFYVGYGTGDPTNGGPKALGAFLKAANWPVRVAEHPFPHGAREEYLDEAFAFWKSWNADAAR